MDETTITIGPVIDLLIQVFVASVLLAPLVGYALAELIIWLIVRNDPKENPRGPERTD